MNTTYTTIILVALAAIGYLGYSFFYTWQPQQDELVYDVSYDQNEDTILESDFNHLEGMEFDGSEESSIESQEAFDSQITFEENQEASFDAELDELEAMEF